jgi:prolyl 4-hydroxylase
MFERMITAPENEKYEPKVLSRPEYINDDTADNATSQLGPWMLVMENFVSDDEAERLMQLGGIEGYERSSDVGNLKFDGTFDTFVNEGRTSMNAWCQKDCYNDPLARSVMERITNITGIPEPNSEYLQLLRYEVGQFYQTHHDLITHQFTRQPGVRLLTVYIYLNDVEEGGGTNFPQLGLTVTPERGRVVMWPSVMNDDPNQIDRRTEHQAMPVIKGVKYGT